MEARLTPDKGRIKLTRAAEDSGLYHGWAGFVTEIEAEDQSGRPLTLEYEVPGVWRVNRPPRGEIIVHYAVNLQHDRFPNEPGDNELATAHSYGVMWTGRALFLEGVPSNEVTVEFEVPSAWNVSTPWPKRSGDRWVFTPKDTDALLDSAFMAGTHHQIRIDLGEAQALIALGPPVEQLEPVFERLIRGYFSAYTELFGDAPKDNFLLIGTEASFLGGGVMGRTISLSLNEQAMTPKAHQLPAHIIAHEGFHLWNVQWGDPSGPWSGLEWFKEGLAEYYAFLVSLRLKVIDEEAFLQRISEHYAAYLTALASGKTLVSAAATKNTSRHSYDLIYSGGMMVCLLLDLQIRSKTNSNKSLDDVVRAIHREFAGAKAMLTLAALGQVIKQETGIDFGGVIRANLRGGHRLDLTDAFAFAGLRAEINSRDGITSATISRVNSPSSEQQKHYRRWAQGE